MRHGQGSTSELAEIAKIALAGPMPASGSCPQALHDRYAGLKGSGPKGSGEQLMHKRARTEHLKSNIKSVSYTHLTLPTILRV